LSEAALMAVRNAGGDVEALEAAFCWIIICFLICLFIYVEAGVFGLISLGLFDLVVLVFGFSLLIWDQGYTPKC
jgi:uncharacterized membrane protein